MGKCGGCGKFLSGGATCTKCQTIYHRQCVNLNSNQTPKHWLCPSCVSCVPHKDNTNTPLKDPLSLVEQCSEESPLRVDDSSDQLVLQEIRALRKDMNGFRKEFGCFREEVRDEIKDLRGLYQGCDSKMESFSERLDKQDSRLLQLETACEETQNLKKEILNLKQELRNRAQLTLQNDIEISGVTEHSGESVMHIVGLITNKIGVIVDERDIVEVRRVGPIIKDQDGKQRPRPIVMRVTRRAVREQVLRSARTRRNITTGDVNLAGTPRPIYLNERLTKENRLLFNKARLLCKQHNWKYAWTREGNILIRETDGKAAFRVHDENDFIKIFK